jgi:hypothetical protein
MITQVSKEVLKLETKNAIPLLIPDQWRRIGSVRENGSPGQIHPHGLGPRSGGITFVGPVDRPQYQLLETGS